MDRSYWDKKFETYNAEIFDVLKSDKTGIIRSWIKEVASTKKTIGDIGCGIGKWLNLLSKQYKEVVAVDFAMPNVKFCEKKFKNLKNIKYLNLDLTSDLKGAYKFDAILCVNAILSESASKRKMFFNNLASSLNSKGNLILVVPSLESSLYSSYVLEKINQKREIEPTKESGTVSKNELVKLRQGVVPIDNVATKHYLREELISTLNDIGLKVLKIDKVKYTWDTEIDNPPKSLKSPYPWDWVVLATKTKR